MDDGKTGIDDFLEGGGKVGQLKRVSIDNLSFSATENLTDLGNAKRLIRQHGANLRYVAKWKRWIYWNGKQWVKDEDGEIFRRAKDTVSNIYIEASRTDDESLRKTLARHALRSESENRINAMVHLAATEAEVQADPKNLDVNPWLFNCLNGTINLRTGKIEPHNRMNLITKIAPVEYSETAECSKWIEFMDQIMGGNQDLIKFLQKCIGYILTGQTSERVIFIFYGTGDNGKTTLISTIECMMGDYAMSTPTETLMTRKTDQISNDIARLAGARFVNASESDSGSQLNEGRIKRMSGGKDKLTARFMRAEFFDFQPAFKIVLATNHKPNVKGLDNAIWNRIRLVPFEVTISKEKQDQELTERLKGEFSGILRWAIEGCLLWQKEGLSMPKVIAAANDAYRQAMDRLQCFLDERTIKLEGTNTSAGKIWKEYQLWCNESRDAERLTRPDFVDQMKSKGYEQKKDTQGPYKGKIFWQGIGLLIGEKGDNCHE